MRGIAQKLALLIAVLAMMTPEPASGRQSTAPGPLESQIFDTEFNIEKYVFPPDLIITHQQELQLSDNQKERIVSIVEDFERATGFGTALAFSTLSGKVRDALEVANPDPDVVMNAAEELMELESNVKLAHLKLLVEVRNVLTAEQQETLRTLRGGWHRVGVHTMPFFLPDTLRLLHPDTLRPLRIGSPLPVISGDTIRTGGSG